MNAGDDPKNKAVPPVGTIVYAQADGIVKNLKTLTDAEFDKVCAALNIHKPSNALPGDVPTFTVPPTATLVYIDQSDYSLKVSKNLSEDELVAACGALGVDVPGGGGDVPTFTVPPVGT